MSKVWLITGSSRGLGRDLAKAVLASGDRLVATARKAADVQYLVEEYGDRVRAVPLDVTDPKAARSAVAAATSAFGRLDVVVNNAGYANINSIEDVAEDDFRAQVETNFFGVVNVTRAAIPVLREQRHGHILQISSVGGRLGSPGLAAYQSSKWAVEGFSEVLAGEMAPFGVRVTIVEPGGFRTDWAGSSMRVDEIRPEYMATVGAMKRNPDIMRGDPSKAAQAILKLAALEAPPLRLLLGTDAFFLANHITAKRAEEDARFKSISVSTDFDGLGDFADTPIARFITGRT